MGAMMKITRRRFLSAGAAASVSIRCSSAAMAQAYPTRSIRLVVPFPPGGAFDFVGRPWAEKIKSSLGTVVVENIGGGGSSLGAAAVVRSPPDGYTLLLGGTQTHVNEALLKSRPLYDPAKDLDAVTGVAAYYLAIVVHPALAVQSLQDLREYAKANPKTVSYGHAGVGSIQHLTGELLKSETGMHDMVQVPYRGTGPVITDVMSGQIPVGILGITGQVLELHRAGKLRMIAVTSPKRLASTPDVPTAAESGLPGMIVTGSIGLLAPAGTPRPLFDQISQATAAALADPTFQHILKEAAMEPIAPQGPDNWRRILADDISLWGPLVKSLGLKID
jgi:tripartite-type tricarboxylate transporter receptor subunit TctC